MTSFYCLLYFSAGSSQNMYKMSPQGWCITRSLEKPNGINHLLTKHYLISADNITVRVGGVPVVSKKFINVLGITFDSKLDWTIQVSNCIAKAKKALYALRQIKNFFTPSQMRLLLDSNFYSVLYYNATVWLTPSLRSDLKHDLLTVSALALRCCMPNHQSEISFINVHKLNCKCTPEQIMLYQIALNLYKIVNFNNHTPSTEVITVLEKTVNTRSQVLFEILRTNVTRIGTNSIENKLYHINKVIPLDNLNMPFVAFKRLMKIRFLKFGKT